MVLKAIETGAIYNKSGAKKRWIEPTSGNTGKGLAEIANLLGVEFTAVFSRLDVSEEIKGLPYSVQCKYPYHWQRIFHWRIESSSAKSRKDCHLLLVKFWRS